MTKNSTVKSTVNALRIIQTVKELDNPGVTEVANHLNLSKTAVYNQLTTLEDHGFITKTNAKYKLGRKLLEYGMEARKDTKLYQVSKQTIDELSEINGGVVNLSIPDGPEVVYLYQSNNGSCNVPDLTGCRFTLGSVLSGVAILSCYTDSELDEMSEVNVDSFPENTWKQINQLRTEDYAQDTKRFDQEWQVIATPITDIDNRPLGAIELMIPSQEVHNSKLEVEIPGHLAGAVQKIQVDLVS